MIKKIILIFVFLCFISLSKADTQLNPGYSGDTQIQGSDAGDLHFNYNFPTRGVGTTTTTTTTTTITTTTTTIKPLEQAGGGSGAYGGSAATGTGLSAGITGITEGIEPGVGLTQELIGRLGKEDAPQIDFGKIYDEDLKKPFLDLMEISFKDKLTGAVTAIADVKIFEKIKYYNANFIKNIKNIYTYIVKRILRR